MSKSAEESNEEDGPEEVHRGQFDTCCVLKEPEEGLFEIEY